MIIFKQAKRLTGYLNELKKNGYTIGFVPTMGALHQGHISLAQQSNAECRITVCSIFINPTQFNDPKDFEKYPVTIENDIRLLEQSGVDILFLPAVDEIYPKGFTSPIQYQLGYLENILEGFYRPGHFQGVCQVVHALLCIVEPSTIFMGRKDYQQCMVVQKLISLEDLPVVMQACDTLREHDGLAMSSRNLRLTPKSRLQATAIYQALTHIKLAIRSKPIQQLKLEATAILTGAGFGKIDYVEICDAHTLLPVDSQGHNQAMVALIATFLDGVRLIDNLIIPPIGG